MAKRKKEEELLNRREFFKKTAKRTLPILGIVALTPLLTGCPDPDEPLTCYDCSNSCEDSCYTTCSTTCEGTSKSSSCSGCSNSCSGSCASSCQNTSSYSEDPDDDIISSATGTIDGYEYVDLGLSVKWARCNFNALNPEDSGEYCYWGDSNLKGKNAYSELKSAGYIKEDACISGTRFDTAYKNMSSRWKMPTHAQCEELVENCYDETVNYNGVKGHKLTSMKNGNSIFIPYAGAYIRGVLDNNNGSQGVVLSGTLESLGYDNVNPGANIILMNEGSNCTASDAYSSDIKDYRVPIRPVTGSGSSQSCNGNCTGKCSGGCSSSCSGGCEGSSKSSSCSSCSNNCTGECTNSCAENCSNNCSSGCSSGCYTGCMDSCSGSCSSTCVGTCTGRCLGTCTSDCRNDCTYNCYGTCYFSCSYVNY